MGSWAASLNADLFKFCSDRRSRTETEHTTDQNVPTANIFVGYQLNALIGTDNTASQDGRTCKRPELSCIRSKIQKHSECTSSVIVLTCPRHTLIGHDLHLDSEHRATGSSDSKLTRKSNKAWKWRRAQAYEACKEYEACKGYEAQNGWSTWLVDHHRFSMKKQPLPTSPYTCNQTVQIVFGSGKLYL